LFHSRRTLAIIEATLAVIFWGASFVATKVAIQEVSPATVVWLRFAMGILVLGGAVLLRRQFVVPVRSDLPYFALLGFLGITFHQWLQSTGLQTAQATTTSWIVATTPIFMALLGWLILKERLLWLQILGIGVAFLGVLLVVTEGDLSSLAQGKFGTYGDFLILLSAPNWALFSVLSRRGLQRHPASLLVFYVMIFGWLFTTVLFILGAGWAEIANLSWKGWLAIGFLGVFCSGISYVFWYDALAVLPVAQTGAFVYIEPFVTVVVAAVVLDEPLLLAAVLGGLAILVGVWLVQAGGKRAPQRTEHAHRSNERNDP
jgi:drug/metabolite transporter (DMT)-like permease